MDAVWTQIHLYFIPCTSLCDGHHTVSVVYLDDKWIAIDITALMAYECNTKDVDRSNWTAYDYCAWDRQYGYMETDMDSIDDQIFKYEVFDKDK